MLKHIYHEKKRRKKMKVRNKEVMALLATVCLAAGSLAGCGNTSGEAGQNSTPQSKPSVSSEQQADSNTGKDENVTLRIFMRDQATPDDEKVEDYINSLPQVQDLNVTIDLVKQAGGAGEHNEKVPLLLATDEQMDIGWDGSGDFVNRIVQGAYLDISEYLKADPDFYNVIPEALWNGMKYEDGIYGVPTYKEIAEQWAISTDSYILEKYNIDPSTITDFQDLEPVLEAIKQEGDRTTLTLKADQYWYLLKLALLDDYDFINDYRYAVVNHEEGKTIVSPFGTEEFEELVRTMYSWNQKGYVHPDALTIVDDKEFNEGGLKQSERITSYTPFSENNWAETYGWEDTTVMPLTGAPKVTNGSARGSVFGIYSKCQNPDKAYEFLKLWNTDPEVKNAMYLGIPDVHYTVVDGKAQKVAEKDKLFSGQNWTTGNNLISMLEVNDPDDKWEQFEAWNKTAIEAKDLGICLNTDNIADKQASVSAVMAEYLPPLVLGFVEPEAGIAQLNEQMKAAGLDEVIAEIQTQYDAFLATK